MNKIFNARLGIEAIQHNNDSSSESGNNYIENRKGDYILFNPVSLKYCHNLGENNCYSWLFLNKNDNNTIDLLYLEEINELSMTTNSFTILENYTSEWNDSLSVDDSYNIPEIASPPFAGYDYNKARLPLASEIDSSVLAGLKENMVANLGLSPSRTMLTIYNDTVNNNTAFGMYGYTNSGITNSKTAPLAAASSYTNTSNTYYYIHPVIRVENKKNDTSDETPESEYPYYAYHGQSVTDYTKYKDPQQLMNEKDVVTFLKYDKNSNNNVVVSSCFYYNSKVTCIEGKNWDTYDTYNLEKELYKLKNALGDICVDADGGLRCDMHSASLYSGTTTKNDFWVKLTSRGHIEVTSYYYSDECVSDLYSLYCQRG